MRHEYLSIIHDSAWNYMDLDSKFKLCLHNGVKLSNNETTRGMYWRVLLSVTLQGRFKEI